MHPEKSASRKESGFPQTRSMTEICDPVVNEQNHQAICSISAHHVEDDSRQVTER